MHGFTRRHTVQQAIDWLDAQLHTLDAETRSRFARPRAASSPPAIVSDIDVPGFDRATMDGYAVVADSTEGATPYNRVALTVVGDALPGSPFARSLARGEAVRIMTGAPMPAGSDAVLPAESVDACIDVRRGGSSDPPESRRYLTFRPARTSVSRGEDVVAGTTCSTIGRVLRPQDLGVMSSIGLADVTCRPSAARPACDYRQRAAARGLEAARFSDHRRQRTDARRTRRARRRDRGLPRPGSRRARGDSGRPARRRGHRHRLRRLERRHRGPRAHRSSLLTANWRYTASPCGRAARPAWAGLDSA